MVKDKLKLKEYHGSGSLRLAQCISESAKFKPGSKHNEQKQSNQSKVDVLKCHRFETGGNIDDHFDPGLIENDSFKQKTIAYR